MNEIYHHGILGQRWGVRRYQNKDGSLTPNGKKHLKTIGQTYREAKKAGSEAAAKSWKYDKEHLHGIGTARKANHNAYVARRKAAREVLTKNKKYNKDLREKRKLSNYSQDARDVYDIKKKKVSEMTNAELRKLNERQNLERQYNSLNPSTIKKGMAVVGATAATLGTINGLYNNGNKIIKLGRKIVKNNK